MVVRYYLTCGFTTLACLATATFVSICSLFRLTWAACAAAAVSLTGGDTVTWCNLATRVRVGTWTVRCTEWSNNTVDKGGVSSCKAHAIPTKIPGDFRSKEVVIFMGARFKLPHLEYVRRAPAAAPEPPRCSFAPLLNFNRWINCAYCS